MILAVLHKFYPILPNSDWVARLVPLGVKTIQLRVKGAPASIVREEIKRSLSFCAEHDCQLVVNDYWEEAVELGADYVHLGQEDMVEADIPAIRRAGLKIGVSTHSLEELTKALAVAPDYVALGPIYETKLKVMSWAPQGLARIGEWKRLIRCPLVAIGGITLERAPDVFAAGADSIAVVTDIAVNPDPEKRVKKWLSLCTTQAG